MVMEQSSWEPCVYYTEFTELCMHDYMRITWQLKVYLSFWRAASAAAQYNSNYPLDSHGCLLWTPRSPKLSN